LKIANNKPTSNNTNKTLNKREKEMKQHFHILHSIGAKVYTTVKILH